MTINLQKEGAAIRALLDKADRLEADADQKTVQAEDCRWQAARRTSEVYAAALVDNPRLSHQAFAKEFGHPRQRVVEMLRVWELNGAEYRQGTSLRYWEAAFLANEKDVEGLRQRAIEQGRKASTVRQSELKTSHTLQQAESAKAVMANPVVREAARRAIIAAEADEARAKLMATANPVDIPVPVPGFDWMQADATLSHARKLINSVSRMVKDHSPLGERDREMLADSVREVGIALEILDVVVKAGDLDEAFARMLDGEG